MSKAVIIGAGKQGRGILAYICYINGLTPVFVDQDEILMASMKQKHHYHIHVLQDVEEQIALPCVEVISIRDDAALYDYIKDASLIFTSVPSKQIQTVGHRVGQVMIDILQKDELQEKNIILCENSSDKIQYFQRGLEEVLNEQQLAKVQDMVGVCEALSMSLAIESRNDEDVLSLSIQQKMRLYINKNRMKGDLPRLKAIHYVDNYESLRQQALYTNNTSSAFVSYLGYLMGYHTLKEAMRDSIIKEQLDLCYNEINLTLIKELGVSPTVQKEFADFARRKYEQSDDLIERHAREVLRKLGHEERLTGICEKALKHGIVPQTISLGLAAALFYTNTEDKEAVELASLRKHVDLESLLMQVCGIVKTDPLVNLIRQNMDWLIQNNYLCHNEIMTKC